jgi:hypothetical protein
MMIPAEKINAIYTGEEADEIQELIEIDHKLLSYAR